MKGLIGKKVGMTQVFDEQGQVTPVTVIEAGPCYVTQVRTNDRDGYAAVQLGYGVTKPKRLSGARLGHLKRNNLPALGTLREFRLRNGDLDVTEGQELRADVFAKGEFVDVVGISKGRGFAGTIKRHNFNRQPKTHGQSDRERAPGSVGMNTFPARTLKGQRMAGRMGNDRVTAQNLRVEVVDAEKNLLAVRGSVPGRKGGIVLIKAAVKKAGK